MIDRQPIIADRVRNIAGSFAFIEHRFLQRGFWAGLSHHALLLYFFLVLAADRRGLSFYGYDRQPAPGKSRAAARGRLSPAQKPHLEETMFDEGKLPANFSDAVGNDGLTVDHGSTSWLYSEMVASNEPMANESFWRQPLTR